MEIAGTTAFMSLIALLLCGVVAVHRAQHERFEGPKPAVMDLRADVVRGR